MFNKSTKAFQDNTKTEPLSDQADGLRLAMARLSAPQDQAAGLRRMMLEQEEPRDQASDLRDMMAAEKKRRATAIAEQNQASRLSGQELDLKKAMDELKKAKAAEAVPSEPAPPKLSQPKP